MATQFLTTTEYAKMIKKCQPSGIRRALRKKKLHLLPGVISIKKVGKNSILEVAI